MLGLDLIIGPEKLGSAEVELSFLTKEGWKPGIHRAPLLATVLCSQFRSETRHKI